MAGNDGHRKCYDEYGAMAHLAAEFYLQTVRRVFHDYQLPEGRLTSSGQTARLSAILYPGLLTKKGDRDDIRAIGRTLAGARPMFPYSSQSQAELLADWRRPLRRVCRQALTRKAYPRMREMIHVMD